MLVRPRCELLDRNAEGGLHQLPESLVSGVRGTKELSNREEKTFEHLAPTLPPCPHFPAAGHVPVWVEIVELQW